MSEAQANTGVTQHNEQANMGKNMEFRNTEIMKK